MKALSVVLLLLALPGLGLPAAPPTTIPFSFNLTGTAQCIPVPGTPNAFECPMPNIVGTMPPFGSAQAVLGDDTVTFTLATGAAITAILSNIMGGSATGTITGGTGIFADATGTFQSTVTAVDCTSACSSLTQTLTGSGTIDLPNAPGGVAALPSSLQLQAPQGSSAPVSNSLILSNQGLTTLSFTVSAAAASKTNWLSVSPPSGSVPVASSSSVQVTADPSGMALGVYEGQISVDAGGLPIGVPVRLIVGNKGANLQLSETGASFVAALGGSSPAAQTIQVQNTGAGDLSGLTATTSVTGSEPNWLHASITGGLAGQTTTPVTLTVDPGSLPPGTHYGQAVFSLPSAVNSPQSVSVQMQVNAGPPPTFNPVAVVFAMNSDYVTDTYGPVPAPKTVLITNPGLTTLNFTVAETAATSSSDPWFKFSPASGSLSPGGTASLTVSVDPNCFTNAACTDSLALGNLAALNVTFPEISYVYQLQTYLGIYESTTALCGPGGCSGTQLRPAAAAAACTPTLFRGLITSLPPAFQATVGQPAPLEAAIFDDCGNNLDGGTVVATFPSGDPAVVLNSLGEGLWAATWTPSNAAANAVINVQAASPTGLVGLLTLTGSVAASTSTPIIGAGGIANAASGAPVIAPGAFIAIYGANMAGGLTTASKVPFPTSLGTTQVFLGGQSLPLYFTSAQQIDAIVPYDINPNSSQQLIVQTGDALSQPEPVTVAAAQPGVFTQNQSGSGPGAILGQKPGGVAKLNTAANPASAGDALLIFCTGLGTVTPPVAAGSAASTTKLSNTDNPVTVTVAGDNAQVLFAGLAPGFVGLYQVNVIVPSGIAAADDVPVVLTEAGATSAPVTVAIK
jgi:trimeric autotransporter adhesin